METRYNDGYMQLRYGVVLFKSSSNSESFSVGMWFRSVTATDRKKITEIVGGMSGDRHDMTKALQPENMVILKHYCIYRKTLDK